ncbi:MAG: DEAD/DEAH box helicase family protein [Candidatus Marinimicrobia bacterium]|nr:DEAD/DEAH box helicase family protein [Candidatus Neomarinimicrobiota bacterium]
MQLKIYQENAIDDLLNKTKKLLGYSDNKKLVFKSPTGSGKTIMMAEFLKLLVVDREIRQSLGFIWTAPRKLHIQSKDKLENYFEQSRALKCSYFEDLDDRKISENEILFFNWSSVNKKGKNTIVKENEQEFYLSKVLERTREERRKIVLIIDEVHYSAGQMDKKEKSAATQLRNDINPDLTIEVSATPILKGDFEVDVMLEDVKKEAMIKKALILNENYKNVFKEGKIKTELGDEKIKDSEELVINAAMKKRQKIIKAYQKEKTEINPLVLIQLPRKLGQVEERIREKVESILKNKHKISTEKGNNKLAIWLSGEHINKENVERQDSEVEVLLFKEAIALGWDCPRAQILILFREWHSPIFSIQTVGRIMRMPEPEREKYYVEEILNYGYIYTNLNNIVIEKEIELGYVSFLASKRQKNYKPINLFSCYSKRHREKTRLAPLFIEIFLEQAKEYDLKKKINIKAKKLDLKIIADQKKEDIAALVGAKIVGDKAIKISGFDLQKLFDFFARESLQKGTISLYPEDRSVDKIKQSIYKFLEKEFKISFGEGQDIVLSDKNNQHFFNVIDRAKEKYQKEVVKREPELEFEENWNIRESLTFGEEYIQEERKKSVTQPFYVKYGSNLEKAFIEFLEKSKMVEWWFKNGDRDETFFAVPYENGEPKPFYVDFIVKLKDGRIGLFDPHGTHLSDFEPKADGLYGYIQSENKKGKRLFGGIVANTNQRNYKGRWIYFDKTRGDLIHEDFSNWEELEL